MTSQQENKKEEKLVKEDRHLWFACGFGCAISKMIDSNRIFVGWDKTVQKLETDLGKYLVKHGLSPYDLQDFIVKMFTEGDDNGNGNKRKCDGDKCSDDKCECESELGTDSK